MNEAVLYGLLFYGSIALVLALAGVVVQAMFIAFAARLGSYLLASVPFIALGAGALGVALSKRNLQLGQLFGGVSAEGAGALWTTRIANLILLAIALAKMAQLLLQHRAKVKLWTLSDEQRASRRLFIAFLTYAFCSLVLPMIFGAEPAFSHEGLVAVPMFAAAYLARREEMERLFASTKWILLLTMLGSLVFAAAAPQIAISKYEGGLIPGLSFRLWGLTSHPNYLGALALSLMLMLLLQPWKQRWLNSAAWGIALLVLFLSQSKTSWMASFISLGVVAIYRHGRDVNGRIRLGIWITLLLGFTLLTSVALFVDVGNLMAKFLDSEAGGGLSTFTGRTKVWEIAVDVWLDSPWFGFGPDAWSPLHRTQLGVPFATQAHNQLLEALSTGGLAYAVPMIVYFILLGRAAMRNAEWTRGAAPAFFLTIAIRCISEAPFGIGNMTSGDTVLHLILFMMVVNEARRSEPPAKAVRTPNIVFKRPLMRT